jgi:hypothetical protein
MAKWTLKDKVCVVINYDRELFGVFQSEKVARKAVEEAILQDMDLEPDELEGEMEEYRFSNTNIE